MQKRIVLLAAIICLCFYSSAFAAQKKKEVKTPQQPTQETPVQQSVVTETPAAEQPAVTEIPAAEQPAAQPVVVPEYEKLLEQARSEDATTAIVTLQKAKKLAPNNSKVMNQLISAQLTKGDTEAATNALKEVLAADGFGDLRDWATREYYRLAQEKGDLAAAVAALEQEKGRNPNNTGLISSVIEGYVRTREWPKVADGYQTLLKKNPDDYILNTRLNDVYMIQGNYAEVIKRLEPIVKANPADVGHSDILARAYVGAGMQQEALALYQQKLAVDPNSPGLVGRYAQALTDFGKLDEAANQWDKAYQLDPRNSFFKQKADELKAKLGKTQ